MTPARHALLVGVSYSPWILKNSAKELKYQRLESCAKNIDLMRKTLIGSFDFAASEINVLRDKDATQAAILDAMGAVADRAGKDDVVFFYFTGHGGTPRDPRNPARKLTSIAPFDTGRQPAPTRDIPNAAFDLWVEELNAKTPNVTLIFDCCYSAELGRDPFKRRSQGGEEDPRTLAEFFGEGPLPSFLSGLCSLKEPTMPSAWLPFGRRAVAIGSCRSNEVSWEIRCEDGLNTFPYGALTYHLAQALTDLGPGATWRDVLERVTPRVTAQVRERSLRQDEPDSQHPQIEGDIDRIVYGLKEVRASRYLSVVKTDGEGVELWGGVVHRITPGSLWSIRPHGARDRHDGEEVAQVRVDEVRGATARASLEGSASGTLEAGQRAFLLEVNLREPGLKVTLAAAGDQRGEVEAKIRTSELLALLAEHDATAAQADVFVHRLEPRESAWPDAPCAFLGPLAAPVWVVLGPDGHLQTRPRPAAEGAVGRLVTDLEKLARYRGFKALRENPDPESQLQGKLDLRILDPHGAELEGDGPVVVEEGRTIDFEIANRHTAEVWCSLVEFASDYSITVMTPRRGHRSFRRGGYRLGPGEILRVGRDYYGVEAGLEQVLPEGFPFGGTDDADVAIARMMLLVTTVPADFEFVEQEKTRIVPLHPLRKLALLYHSNVGKRQVILADDDLDKDQDWAVVTREIGVRRRPRSDGGTR